MAQTSKNDDLADQFDNLVGNAIDYFEHAIGQVERQPKYAVIDFCSALELFLKARLMTEHWSLILDRPEQANLQKFKTGDFISVSMSKLIDRINQVVGMEIGTSEREAFEDLSRDRNRVVHFFNERYIKPTEEEQAKLVAKQCLGWYHLHHLLTGRWQEIFERHTAAIDRLDHEMVGARSFLAVKFDALREKIGAMRAAGECFEDCWSCGHPAAARRQLGEHVHAIDCLVCRVHDCALEWRCPHCSKVSSVYEPDSDHCPKCKGIVKTTEVLARLDPKPNVTEMGVVLSRAYCPNCEYTNEPTVVQAAERWVCASCLTDYDHVENCQWCNELNAGDMSMSNLDGCVLCDGKGMDD